MRNALLLTTSVATICVTALAAASPIAGGQFESIPSDGGAGQDTSRPDAAAPDPLAAPRQALRCNPDAHRVIEPLVIEEGDSFQVQVHFDYLCPEGTQPVVFVLAVEGSDQLQPSGFGGRQVLGNVKDGLTAYVEEMDFDNGSKGGLVVYTANASVRAPMEGGNAGKSALLAGIGALSPGGSTARGAAEAVTTSAEMLRNVGGPENAFKALVLLDAGASVDNEEEVVAACAAAAAEGIHVSVMALRNTEARLMPCSEEALYRQSAREGAQDVPEKLEELGYGFTHGNSANGVLIADTLETGMSYLEGSGVPEPSSAFGGELTWDLAGPPPPGGGDVTYRLRPQAPGESPLSVVSALNMLYADGTTGEIVLENPDVCVHRVNRPEDCADFIATLTPPVATPTATEDATAAPTMPVSPSPTHAPGYSLFVPAVQTP